MHRSSNIGLLCCPGRLQCWIEFAEPWKWQVYMTLVSIALFLAPALIISACYLIIVVTIWSKSRLLVPPRRLNSTSPLVASLHRKKNQQILEQPKPQTKG